jgi:hemoglobin-like flavoprotein
MDNTTNHYTAPYIDAGNRMKTGGASDFVLATSSLPYTSAVQQSLARCLKTTTFLDTFYERFLGSHEAIRQKFAHTDMVRQKQLLKRALFVALMYADTSANNALITERVQHLKHSHDASALAIEPWMYDVWLNALVETVAETDTLYTPHIGECWRECMRVTIEYIRGQSHHRQ